MAEPHELFRDMGQLATRDISHNHLTDLGLRPGSPELLQNETVIETVCGPAGDIRRRAGMVYGVSSNDRFGFAKPSTGLRKILEKAAK